MLFKEITFGSPNKFLRLARLTVSIQGTNLLFSIYQLNYLLKLVFIPTKQIRQDAILGGLWIGQLSLYLY